MVDQTTSRFEFLRSIVDGASIFIVGEILYKASGFILNILLARVLGPVMYGIYTFAYLYITVSTMFASLGTDQAVLRFLPKYSDDLHNQNWVIAVSIISTIAGSLSIAAGLFVFSPLINSFTLNDPLFVDVLRIIAILLPLDTLIRVLVNVFRGLGKPTEQIFLQKLIRPGLRVCAVIFALILGFALIGTIAALIVASVISLLLGIILLYKRTSVRPIGARINKSPETTGLRSFFNYSFPLMLSRAGSVLYNRIDLFMVGFFVGTSAVGYYQISFLLSTAITLPLVACNQLFAPIASQLYDEDKLDELNEIYSTVTRWSFTIALFTTVGGVIYAHEILVFIDPNYAVGAPVLILLSLGQLLNAGVGPSNYLLMMTDNQYLTFINHWAFGILNVILNVVLILEYGMIGAAAATASVLGVLNIVRWIEIRQLEGLSPFKKSYYKPFVASVFAGGIMLLPTLFYSGLITVIIGGILGLLVYGICLYLLGFEPSDVELAKDIIIS